MVGDWLDRARIPQSREISRGENLDASGAPGKAIQLGNSSRGWNANGAEARGWESIGVRGLSAFVESPSTSLRAGFRLRSAFAHFAQDDRLNSIESDFLRGQFLGRSIWRVRRSSRRLLLRRRHKTLRLARE
jgi:hypothetical protein